MNQTKGIIELEIEKMASANNNPEFRAAVSQILPIVQKHEADYHAQMLTQAESCERINKSSDGYKSVATKLMFALSTLVERVSLAASNPKDPGCIGKIMEANKEASYFLENLKKGFDGGE